MSNNKLDQKLEQLSKKYKELDLQKSIVLDNTCKTREELKILKNEFSTKYNKVVEDLTIIINNIDTTQDKKEIEEESPASIKATKIINLNKDETYLLDDNKCLSIIEWLGREVKFELLFRASTDGYSASAFHDKCDNKGPTLVVVMTSFDKLIGAYSNKDWNRNVSSDYEYVSDDSLECFLFSLTLGIKCKIKEPTYATCNSPNHGPKFGGGHDLEVVNNCNTTENTYAGINFTYEYTGSKEDFYGGEKFTIPEYEVYRLV